jgi:hypothetical protein
MKTKTVPFSVLRVAHPTIIGETIPLRRTLGTKEEEAQLTKIGKTAFASGRHFRKIMRQTHS